MVICLRPLPISSVSSVICQLSSASASALRPSAAAGRVEQPRHQQRVVDDAGNSRPWRRSTVRSYLALWATVARAAIAEDRAQRVAHGRPGELFAIGVRHGDVGRLTRRPRQPQPDERRLHGVGGGRLDIEGDAFGAVRSAATNAASRAGSSTISTLRSPSGAGMVAGVRAAVSDA
jgi:hypothetical protein